MSMSERLIGLARLQKRALLDGSGLHELCGDSRLGAGLLPAREHDARQKCRVVSHLFTLFEKIGANDLS